MIIERKIPSITEVTKDLFKDLITSGVKTRHKVEIQFPENLPEPPPIDEVKKAVDKDLEHLIDLIYKFLETPILEDFFGNDDEKRDTWESAMEFHFGEEEASKIIHNNKLRPNSLAKVVVPIVALVDYLDREDLEECIESMDKRWLNEKNAYKELPNKEKRIVIDNLHRTAVTLLEKIIEPVKVL